ncbi:MAG TPA: AAA family ATPase, partial [Polyangiales bacterium]|nr:AAA family ATPase [Polyangiales bacterium]
GYVARARAGRGQACLVRGEPGSGRSRLLEAFAQRAEHAGLRVVRASAGLLDGSPFRLLRELSQALDAETTETVSSPLGAAWLQLRGDLPFEVRDDAHSGELQGAFLAFCEQACAEQALCIAIDDIERADAPSLRVLGQLVRRASERRFLLALAGGAVRVPGNTPLGTLLRQAAWIETAALDAVSCETLVRSVFGEVPNAARSARWAHRHSSGHPGACLSLLEYLVSSGAAKFVAGSWQLPDNLDGVRLPEHGHAQLELALTGREAGRNLLALLALSTRPFALELSQYAAILPGTGARALDELVKAQLLLATHQGYVLRDPGALEWMAESLGDERRAELHALLARGYEQHGPQHAIQVAYHAWQAGDRSFADQLLTRIARGLPNGLRELVWRPGGLSVPPQLFEAVLEYRKARGASPAELYVVRSVLLAVTTVSDIELARYAGETLDQLRRDVGLDLWDDTDSNAPDATRLERCFERARARHAALPESERGLPVEQAVSELISCVAMLGATCTFTFNVELARQIAASIAPLRELNATSRVIAKLSEITYQSLVLGDRTLALRREVVAATALEAAPDIDPVARDAVHHITMYYLAMDRASEARSEALELAARLEAQPLWEVLGLQVRRIHALGSGNFDEAQRLRRRRELSALRTERADNHLNMAVLREQQMAFQCSDLLELNRSIVTLEGLAQRFPGWQPWLTLGRAQMLVRSDDPHGAAELLEAELARLAPFSHDAWHGLNTLLCDTKLELRDYAAARRIALTTLEGAAGLGIDINTELKLRTSSAVADAGLGDPASAARNLNQWIAALLVEPGPDSVLLGVVRESACQVALIAKDYASFSAHLAALGESYARHPGLRSRHAAWVRKGTQRFRGLIAVLEKANAAKDWSVRIASRLSSQSAEDRSEYLLSFVLDELEIDAGQLYRVEQNGKCRLLASRPGSDEPQLMAAVERSLTTWWSADEEQTADEDTEQALQDSQGRTYLPLWLTKPTHADDLVGVMLLNCTPEQLSKLTPTFVKAVALHLETIS